MVSNLVYLGGVMICYEDFTSLSALGGFCGSLRHDTLINIETLVIESKNSFYRVWYWNIK